MLPPSAQLELAAPTRARKRKALRAPVAAKKKRAANGEEESPRVRRRREVLLRAQSRNKMSPEEWRDAYDVRIREALTQGGLTHGDVADWVKHPPTSPKAGKPLGRSAVTNWLNRISRPSVDQYNQLAELLKQRAADLIPEKHRTAHWLAYGQDMEPVKVLPDTDELGYHMVPEVEVKGPDRRHRTPHSMWGLEADFLRADLDVRSIRDVVVVRAREDSQGVEFGDRMVVDCSEAARSPSPPGKFLIWDGFAPVVATITLLPPSGKKPRVRVVTAAGEIEVDPEKVEIIGRVRGVWKKV